MTKAWEETSVSCSKLWNEYTDYSDFNYYYNGGPSGWRYYTITNTVKKWKAGTSSNNGVMLKSTTEYSPCQWVTIASSEYSTTASRPYIVINYNAAVPVTSVSLPACSDKNVNWSGYISATIYPPNATNQTKYWQSSDNNVATVDYYTGLICTKAVGTTIITVTTADGGKKAYCTLTVNKRGIVVVAGLMASELYTNASFSNRSQVWEPSSLSTVSNLYNNLKINANGTSYDSSVGVWMDDQRPSGSRTYGATSAYSALINKLKQSFPSLANDIYLFSYDWRFGNETSAIKLEQFINDKGLGPVSIIAHSMGGLVASKYISRNNNYQKIDKLIMVASPLLGTPKTYDVFANGDSLTGGSFLPHILSVLSGLGLSFSDLAAKTKQLAPNLQSGYELLPSPKYFSLNSNVNPIYYYNPQQGTDIINTYYDGHQATKDFLLSSQYQSITNTTNNSMMDSAVSFHNSLFLSNGEHITALCDTYYLVGTGKATTSFIERRGPNMLPRANNLPNGDGTVVFWSADIGNKYPSKTYYIKDSTAPWDAHTGMVQNTGQLNFIVDILNGTTSNYANRGFTKTRPSITRLDDTQIIQ